LIVTRTPFRVTLGGGGTDLPSYYKQYGGFVFAMGIDKHMYVMVNPPIVDRKVRLHYSQSETVDHIDELGHELAREALRLNGIEDRMEVASMADLPSGTGLGSSSSYLVGLLNALHHYRRDYISLPQLAEEACHIELNMLAKPIGKQDQYMAAFGGLTVLEIARDGKVQVSAVDLGTSSLAALVANTHIYYTRVSRNALEVISEQDHAMTAGDDGHSHQVADSLHQIKDLGRRILSAIRGEDFDTWGQLLHEHWIHKKRLSPKISLGWVDQLYNLVRREYGVLGGKLIGAGGGGFLMLYTPSGHKRLEQFMASHRMPRLHYSVQPEGSTIVASLDGSRSTLFHPSVTVGTGGPALNGHSHQIPMEPGLSMSRL
jgi:D-glycero-alpha-D-manno-heptose-7-phosphate kinase